MRENIRLLKTGSMFSMWGWVRALRQAYKFWNTRKKRDKPVWPDGGVFRCPVELELEDTGTVVSGFGTLSLAKGSEYILTVTYEKEGLQVGPRSDTAIVDCKTLRAILVSSDYMVPAEYDMKVEVVSSHEESRADANKATTKVGEFSADNNMDNIYAYVYICINKFLNSFNFCLI